MESLGGMLTTTFTIKSYNFLEPHKISYSVLGGAAVQEASEKSKIHDLILKDRKSLSITGVIDVDSFDEETVVVYTDQGELTVRGENLHIIKISLDSGDVSLDGTITALVYTDNGKLGKQNFFSRLFK